MSEFFISCKESKIENNRSFYGCFNLGPFEPSQSITIANALRRTLLSELYGLSIVSVEIEGVTHEYSNLSGVKDSVLDILLNLKEIIFKKNINPLSFRNHWNFSKVGNEQGIKPQIGYLKVRGPGLVRASNLRLPPFIQCVDPDQYIATLAEDGFLNMKFIIQYGNKWASTGYFTKNSNKLGDFLGSTKTGQGLTQDSNFIGKKEQNEFQINSSYVNKSFNLHLKKRRLILKKLRHIGLKFSNNYINLLGLLKKKNISNLSFSDTFQKNKNLIDPLMGSWVIRNQIKFNSTDQTKKLFSPNGALTPLGISDEGFAPYHKEEKKILHLSNPIEVNNSESSDFLTEGKYDPIEIAKKQSVSKKYPAINLRKKNKINSEIRSIFFSKDNLIEKKSNSDFKFKLQKSKSIGEIVRTRLFNKIIMSKSNLINSNIKGDKAPDLLQRKKIKSSVKLFLPQIGSRIKNKSLNSSIFLNSTPLVIDAIFNPVTKVNYIIEVNDFKTTQNSFDLSTETHELFDILNISSNILEKENSIDDTITTNFSTSISSKKIDTVYSNKLNFYKTPIESQALKISLENILKMKNELNNLKKETIKHNIIIEIWTNGSIHPRDAIYEAFKNLIKVFSKLNKVNAFMVNPFISNSLDLNQNSKSYNLKLEDKQKKSTIGTVSDFPDTIPLNETSFLATYMSPKLKKYYSTNFSNPIPDSVGAVLNLQNKNRAKIIKQEQFSKSNLALNISNNIKKKLGTFDISVLNLSLRTYTCLKRLNINSIDELLIFLKTNTINLENSTEFNNKIQDSKIKLSKFSLEEIKTNLFRLEKNYL